MGIILVSEDLPGKAYWRCTECGWESEAVKKHEIGPEPHHSCPRKPVRSAGGGDIIMFDEADKE